MVVPRGPRSLSKSERAVLAIKCARRAFASSQRVAAILERIMSVLGAHELAAARLEPLRESLLGSRRRCEAELRDAQEALDVLLDASEDEPRSPS